MQLRLVSVSVWSSFGRNRNSTVLFCRNRNQTKTIFLGGFGRNTVTETESGFGYGRKSFVSFGLVMVTAETKS